MGIKRYKADADNTIVNAYQSNLSTRGTGSNSGQSDIMEVFSIYGRQTPSSSAASASQELSRILVKFPISDISSDRSAATLPASGSVSFYLRLFASKSSKAVPKDYKLVVQAVSQSWEEGDGLDLENYKDLTKDGVGSNWMNASGSSSAGIGTWTTVGGDYHDSPTYVQHLSSGIGDLEVDISGLVESWIAGTKGNYGVGVRLSSSYEAYFSSSDGSNSGSVLNNPSGSKKSYYTKRFFARGSQYFFKRPVIEARWDSTTKDDRSAFHWSSSLASADDNLNTIYLYNYIRGKLQNIPSAGTGHIYVSLYSGSSDNTAPSGSKIVLYNGNTEITGGYVSTGIYSCSLAITKSTSPRGANTEIKTLYDVWHDNSGNEFFTGTISPLSFGGQTGTREPTYYINITNLENEYMRDQTARFNLYVRNKYWSPTVYTKATQTTPTTTIQSASYRVIRILDGLEAVAHGTGSDLHTVLSYDVSGNYFDLDMKLLEPGYEYGPKLAFYDTELSSWQEQRPIFKFRVKDYEH